MTSVTGSSSQIGHGSLVAVPAPTAAQAQLGVGVAHVEPRQAALAVLAHDRLPGQAVVDDALGVARPRMASAGGWAGQRARPHGGDRRGDGWLGSGQAPGRSSIYRIDMSPRYLARVAPHGRLTHHRSATPMLELAVLGLLEDNDLHGYELRKRLGELLGQRLSISFGSLYPALGRLEAAGLVKASRAGPPPGARGAHERLAGGRARRLPLPAPRGVGRRARRAGARRCTASPRAGGSGCARCWPTPTCPTTASSSCAPRSATTSPRPTASPCSSAAATSWPSGPRPARAVPPAPAPTAAATTYLRSLRERDTAALEADIAWLDRLIAGEGDGTETSDDTEIP